MTWSDQPTTSAPTLPEAPAPVVARPRLGGLRRGVATAFLAAGLLVVGGAAAVFAADPSASPQASQGTDGSGSTDASPDTGGRAGRAAGDHGDCPDKGNRGGGADDDGGSAAPSTDDSTSSPSTDDL